MRQLFITPTRDGWGVIAYGDAVLPDDEIIPLPLTPSVSYAEACDFVRALPVASGAFIDGWSDLVELAELEPELLARITA